MLCSLGVQLHFQANESTAEIVPACEWQPMQLTNPVEKRSLAQWAEKHYWMQRWMMQPSTASAVVHLRMQHWMMRARTEPLVSRLKSTSGATNLSRIVDGCVQVEVVDDTIMDMNRI